MGSFTTNMYNHITLETKGAAVYLTVKESYTYTCSQKEKYFKALYEISKCEFS